MTFPEIVGATEIAELLGVTRQRVQQLATTTAFPAPVYELKMGKIWLLADVERWADASGRQLQQKEGGS